MRALDEVSHQGDVALDIVPVGKLNRGVHVAHRDPDGARQGPGASSLHRRSIGAAPHGHLVRDLVAARGVHQQVVERPVGNGEPVEPIDADAGSEAGVLKVGETSVRGSKPPTGCTRMKPRSSIALTMKPISSRWAATITFSGGASPLVRDARRTAIRFPSRSTRTSSAWGSSSARARSRTASSQPDTPGASQRARSNCSLMVHVHPAPADRLVGLPKLVVSKQDGARACGPMRWATGRRRAAKTCPAKNPLIPTFHSMPGSRSAMADTVHHISFAGSRRTVLGGIGRRDLKITRAFFE